MGQRHGWITCQTTALSENHVSSRAGRGGEGGRGGGGEGTGGEGWKRGGVGDGLGGMERGRDEWEGEGGWGWGVGEGGCANGRTWTPCLASSDILPYIKICSFICSSIYIRPSLICRQGQFRYTRCARSKKPLVIVLASFNNAPGNCSRRMPRSYWQLGAHNS